MTFEELLELLGTCAETKPCPGAIQLRQTAHIVVRTDHLEVFDNGYAIYDNGDRKTVIWVPGCTSIVYHFYPTNEHTVIDALPLPWETVLTVHGENLIERNLKRQMSSATASDLRRDIVNDMRPDLGWTHGSHVEDPEESYLLKEAYEERMAKLTDKQREVYRLYYEEGYTQEEIGDMLGIAQQCVGRLLSRARINHEKRLPHC